MGVIEEGRGQGREEEGKWDEIKLLELTELFYCCYSS